jgi:hypothetical protein
MPSTVVAASSASSVPLPTETYFITDGRVVVDWNPENAGAASLPIKVIDSLTRQVLTGTFTLSRGAKTEVRFTAPDGHTHLVNSTVKTSSRSRAQQAIIKFLFSFCHDLQFLNLDSTKTAVLPGGKGGKGGSGGGGVGGGAAAPIETPVFDDLFGRVKIIKGRTQSGKTKFMLSAAIRLLLEGISSLIVLRNNNGDLVQTRSRINGMKALLEAFLRAHRIDPAEFSIQVVENELTDAEYREFTTGTKPKILVSICYAPHLATMTDRMPEAGEHDMKYALIIDEADLLDSSTSEAAAEIKMLKQHAYTTFGVSATVMDKLMNERVRSRDLIQITNPSSPAARAAPAPTRSSARSPELARRHSHPRSVITCS